ncbi:MAG: hypothetical protein UU59_C0014G0017 [candidate division WWE3 bacterium GW2011_GWE1_41_27]|uniref:Uncharacterized protein n=2 Tax=Katanobacteria TaxID=422282 RepID=A0A0G1AEP2_UNCKA|nr:MAG: hypothetical protein UU59_C0014G0017 [candidate division WWE3 bacterium GW2011_GWE1_41_27]KKS59394.1 MAG: hypothetical protein UV26_C0024G0020 [candidate division WWE3 bacterium GW2011_GWF2_42_42]
MKKKSALFVVITLIALLGISAVVLVSDTADAKGSNLNAGEVQVVPTQSFQVVDGQGKVVYGGVPFRLTILSESLGMPMDKLEKLSPEEVMQLFIDNAAKLEVNVYKSVQDKSGQWVPVLVAKGRGTVDQPAPTSIP